MTELMPSDAKMIRTLEEDLQRIRANPDQARFHMARFDQDRITTYGKFSPELMLIMVAHIALDLKRQLEAQTDQDSPAKLALLQSLNYILVGVKGALPVIQVIRHEQKGSQETISKVNAMEEPRV